MMRVWDTEENEWATGYDGSPPLMGEGRLFYIKELSRYCSAEGCGGCKDSYEEHTIGSRFILREDREGT